MLNQMQLLSPVGQLFVGADEYAIKYLDIGSPSAALAQASVKQTPLLHQACLQLQAYFFWKIDFLFSAIGSGRYNLSKESLAGAAADSLWGRGLL